MGCPSRGFPYDHRAKEQTAIGRSALTQRSRLVQFFVYFTAKEGQPMGGSPPSAEDMAAIRKFHEDAMESGVIVAAGRLGRTTTRVRNESGEISVTDGPFIEGKEFIPGFTIIEADDRSQAIQWVREYREMMGMPELRVVEIMR